MKYYRKRGAHALKLSEYVEPEALIIEKYINI